MWLIFSSKNYALSPLNLSIPVNGRDSRNPSCKVFAGLLGTQLYCRALEIETGGHEIAMNAEDPDSKQALINLMIGAVPECETEIRSLWRQYDPDVVLADNSRHVTLNATKDRIKFDVKTLDVFWLIGFGGWTVTTAYCPHVVMSLLTGDKLQDVIQNDPDFGQYEWVYRENRGAAEALIDAEDWTQAAWPPDLPRPTPDRSSIDDQQFKATFDLTLSAVAFAMFHEFRHVMLDRDNQRPSCMREEEMACDVWAREVMTKRLAEYPSEHGFNYQQVLRRRSMAFGLAALILHEITPVWEHGGNNQYFSVADRLRALLNGTKLPDHDVFWIWSSALLIGMLRRTGKHFDPPFLSAKDLTDHLIALV